MIFNCFDKCAVKNKWFVDKELLRIENTITVFIFHGNLNILNTLLWLDKLCFMIILYFDSCAPLSYILSDSYFYAVADRGKNKIAE